jgi:hypothetical protein
MYIISVNGFVSYLFCKRPVCYIGTEKEFDPYETENQKKQIMKQSLIFNFNSSQFILKDTDTNCKSVYSLCLLPAL